MKKTSRKETIIFGIAALTGGLILLNKTITGNSIITNITEPKITSFIGIILILCSIILFLYSLKK